MSANHTISQYPNIQISRILISPNQNISISLDTSNLISQLVPSTLGQVLHALRIFTEESKSLLYFHLCYKTEWILFYVHFSKTNQLSFVLVINRKNTLVFICFVFDHSKTNPVSFVLVINRKNELVFICFVSATQKLIGLVLF